MKKWTPKQIRELRISERMTQKSFGDSLGVTRNYIYYLERGERKPNKTLRLLLDCLEELLYLEAGLEEAGAEASRILVTIFGITTALIGNEKEKGGEKINGNDL